MELRLFNTLSRTKEVFKPLKQGHVGLYSCGPTVYWNPTIGNWRTYVFVDTLRRTLEYAGFDVNHVMNVTDVGHLVGDGDSGEDKIEKAALKEKKSAQAIAEHYLGVFKQDMKMLHIEEPSLWCKATDHITEQIKLIQTLEKKGYTYVTDDGVYFDSTKFKNYGQLARLNVKGLKPGKRVVMGDKRAPSDFALWKFSEKPGVRQQEWDSPWGLGYPGWHIECSAMAMKYLGKTFDIHTGGEDHIPVHHTNEIAQSEGATGKKFVNYWLHGAFLTFKGEKVSKSKGGLYTLSELGALDYTPMHYRYLCYLTHYRKQLDFSLKGLDAARTAYERLLAKYHGLSPSGKTMASREKTYREAFEQAIGDDFNMPVALSVVWKLLDDNTLGDAQKKDLIDEFDRVFGFNLARTHREQAVVSPEVTLLVAEREVARQTKNWKRADELRALIRKKGFDLADTAQGPVLRKV